MEKGGILKGIKHYINKKGVKEIQKEVEQIKAKNKGLKLPTGQDWLDQQNINELNK